MLPSGYLEMDRAELEALDVSVAREVYAAHVEVVEYHGGKNSVRAYVQGLKESTGPDKPISPADWILAIRKYRCNCARCSGRGIYYWGAIINGRPTNSAPCARCGGKGWMHFDDQRRGRAYDNYAIARAVRG